MTTSKKELGAMLIESEETGRELQFECTDGSWAESQLTQVAYVYRLKPIIMYYRVWHWETKEDDLQISLSGVPFSPVDDWLNKKINNAVWLHDFEIEQ